MRYPISIQDFETLIKGGYVYVDKTALIMEKSVIENGYLLDLECVQEVLK